jgi:hypothetical protein
MKRLTKAQISALLTGLDTKLDRSSLGWGYEDEEGIWRVYYPVTIEVLCKRGLLDSNFTDQRVHQRHGGGYTEPKPQNLDGGRCSGPFWGILPRKEESSRWISFEKLMRTF